MSHYESSSSVLLHQLHWLPVQFRKTFKLACLTYKALSTTRYLQSQPPYIPGGVGLTGYLALRKISTYALEVLRWLPITARIQYKILFLVSIAQVSSARISF